MRCMPVAIIWAIILPSLCVFSSCIKQDPYPNGSGLFTCKVDGEVFVPDSDDWKKRAKQASIVNDTLAINGVYNIGDKSESVGIRVENFSGVGTYQLYSREENYGRYSLSPVHAYTNAAHTGELEVTHYIPERGIVAGTFHFTAHNPHTSETFQITEGRFDTGYR